jgi:hypothetical protein
VGRAARSSPLRRDADVDKVTPRAHLHGAAQAHTCASASRWRCTPRVRTLRLEGMAQVVTQLQWKRSG